MFPVVTTLAPVTLPVALTAPVTAIAPLVTVPEVEIVLLPKLAKNVDTLELVYNAGNPVN